MPFTIVICGAGLGGLGAAIALRKKGHEVTVLEGAPKLSEIGAGIQIPPNSARVLKAIGVYEEILKHVVWPENIHFRRYSSGKVIGRTHLKPAMEEKYGFPYWLIHRADYQICLLKYAEELGVEVHLGSLVTGVDEATTTVSVQGGQRYAADLIVGADGIRSKVRQVILGDEDIEPENSSNCAYRATVPGELILDDPEIAHLMSDINANCWIGDGRHIMAYPIRGGKCYNLVMSHPGKAAVGRWNEPGNLDEMKQHYQNFDPTIRKVLNKVDTCLKWKLADLPPLPRWLSKSGRIVLIGDAAHAMVPYLAQGAAMSIEDGAALAECIDRATNVDEIHDALSAFEKIRKPRCEAIQAGSRDNGYIWHIPDGSEQESRDFQMQNKLIGSENGQDHASAEQVQNPNRWSDDQFQPWLFGYDIVSEVRNPLH